MYHVSTGLNEFQPRLDHLFIESFYKSLDKEHRYHYTEFRSPREITHMFRGEIFSCQSLPEVERCCNAFLNAVSRVCSHAPTHGYSRAHNVLRDAEWLKGEWEHKLGIKLTDLPTLTLHTLSPFDKK